MWTVSLPLRVQITKKGYFNLNLNVYRNAHYMTLNKAKVTFKEIVSPFLVQIPRLKSCKLRYTLYPKTNRLCDIANICSIVDKFFCDAFVETGHLEDDNYTFLKSIEYCIGSVDTENPRVDVEIIPIEPVEKDEDMQITLNENEIKEGIKLYLSKSGLKIEKEISVEFISTRNPNSIKANIDLVQSVRVGQHIPEPKTEPDAETISEEDKCDPFSEENMKRAAEQSREADKYEPAGSENQPARAHTKSLFAAMQQPK